ncbi:hypothetical protein RGQ15_17415 [Paracoccus sp. MBLB3053]|uniref:Protein BatD n=1 Tax=Paracoccus aurantius TaxID=3073814 RepID=A0ABU2HXL0_9RHOB|nr:hypothetical protein [Paracoccus sp. MBLB3053]MDS9469344.1 hypothetical protein [Paracoccus sp. MBLB3053]
MIRSWPFWVIVPSWFLVGAALAQNAGVEPRVEITMRPEDGAVTVGTPLQVTVSVLVPNYLVSTPAWPDLQVADAITRMPANAARPGSRRVGDQTWIEVSRVYQFTPQRAAGYDLAEQSISLAYADLETGDPVSVEAIMPAISFTGTVPKGAESLSPFIAASAITLSQSVDGPGDDPSPGAAVTRTVTIEARGTQSMLLPALLGAESPEGLRAYPRQPDLSDTPGQRGAAGVAQRVESVTYVAEAPGEFTLPSLQLRWWNMDSSRIETSDVEGVQFSIVAPRGWHPPGTPDPRRGPVIWSLSVLFLLVLVLGLGRHRIRDGLVRLSASEPVLFRRILRHANKNEIGAVTGSLDRWLARFDRREPPPQLAAALLKAEREIWGPDIGAGGHQRETRRELVAALRQARQSIRSESQRIRPTALPPLNPS